MLISQCLERALVTGVQIWKRSLKRAGATPRVCKICDVGGYRPDLGWHFKDHWIIVGTGDFDVAPGLRSRCQVGLWN